MKTTQKNMPSTQKRELTFQKNVLYYGDEQLMTVAARFDDRCKNGHDTFSITADIGFTFGCLHDEISQFFPDLAKYIKWHLVSTDGPLHYFENTIYHAENGNLEYARLSAVWPDATLEQLSDKIQLADRLSDLMIAFNADMKELFNHA